MQRKIVAVCLVVLMTFVAGSASAMMMGKGMQGDKEKGHAGRGIMAGDDMPGHLLRMVHLLDLTDEQEKAIETIHFAYKKDSIRKNADIDVAEVELREILAKDPVNMAEAEKKIRAAANFRADLELLHLKAKEAVKAKLTPEQLEKLKKHLAAEMKDRMEEKGGMGKGMGMGMGMGKMAGKAKKKCDDAADDNDNDDDDDKDKEASGDNTDDEKQDANHDVSHH